MFSFTCGEEEEEADECTNTTKLIMTDTLLITLLTGNYHHFHTAVKKYQRKSLRKGVPVT